MKPFIHAERSARKFGGTPDDYQAIHDLLDSPKSAFCDIRQRAILHNSFGIYLAERVFGTTIKNSDGKDVCVRDIAEHHVMEDMGRIPTVEDWLKHLPIMPWMWGAARKKKNQGVNLDQIDKD